MSNTLTKILVSAPHHGGLFMVIGHTVYQLDYVETTGLDKGEGLLLRGQRPDTLLVIDTQSAGSIQRISGVADIHDVLSYKGDLYAVATDANTIFQFDASGQEINRWVFPGEIDSKHINCLGVWNDRLVFSAFGDFDQHREYKGLSLKAGYVQDVHTEERLIHGLSQPHSLVAFGEHLLVANSEELEIHEYDRHGKLLRTKFLDGFVRGICISDEKLYVGLSVSRNIENINQKQATIVVLDIHTWEELERIPLPTAEIYSIIPLDSTEEWLKILGALVVFNTDQLEPNITYIRDQINEYKIENMHLSQFSKEKSLEIKQLKQELQNIKESMLWRLTSPLRYLSSLKRRYIKTR